ncbi:MAG: alpha-glucosidase [Mucilaginibacter polytrichastri]|nr:alpha-glucosidase [Mucilaginibacter polytrichastri]
MSRQKKTWWKEAIVYQIYPRSFRDTNGDGIGDLPGITQNLDYIQSLGVDVIWLNPVYSSPNDDNGYDISDYRNIMADFGTMADFDEMLSGMHKRGLKLVMDLVVNHSSDEHEWFKQSRSTRDNPYRDYYHWWPAEKGKPAARWSFFDVNGDAWRYDQQTDAYYLHYFSVKQPDLNWENPKLRNEIYAMMNFWFDKGVDGFRMDVIPLISKDTDFPPLPEKYHGDYVSYYADGANLHAYLQEMHRESLGKYDIMTVGEGLGISIDNAHKLVDEDRHELNMFFHFEIVSLGLGGYKQPLPEGWKLADFKAIHTRWSDVFSEKGWGSVYLGNHDQPRMVSRWGNDSDEFRVRSAKMLHTFLLSMRATPYIYYGDELGMKNIRFDRIEQYRDIETHNWHTLLKNQGENTSAYLEGWKLTARDNGRTPFQWNAGLHAGFSAAEPWISINPDYREVNRETQENDPDSVLNYFRRMARLRKQHPVLVYGDYELIDAANEQVYAYLRTLENERWLVILNFSQKKAAVALPDDLQHCKKEFKISNLDRKECSVIEIEPYEASVYRLEN